MVRVTNLFKSFHTPDAVIHAIDDVSFDVGEGEFFVLLGASGSGKTTTLRALGALEEADSGTIVMDGRVVFSGSTARRSRGNVATRPIAMMFQSLALWPHMSVSKNIAFPLRHGRARLRRDEITSKVREALELLHITELKDRPVSALSGGQQQRVALARAIAQEPKILLMDEPLSALDAKLRVELRVTLKQLTQRLGMTTVYVTHDQTEAMVMADRLGVMHEGRLLQTGTPETVYREPASLYVAEFFGEINILPGTVRATAVGTAVVQTAAGTVEARFQEQPSVDDSVLIGARQEAIRVEPAGGQGSLGTVRLAAFLGSTQLCTIDVGGELLKVQATTEASFAPGDTVSVHFDGAPLVGFSATEFADDLDTHVSLQLNDGASKA